MKLKLAAAHKPNADQAKLLIKMAVLQGESDEAALKQKLSGLFSQGVLQEAVQELLAEGVLEVDHDPK